MSKPVTIGDLIVLLKNCDEDSGVEYDFTYMSPTTVDSWRGVYAEPALGYEKNGDVKVRDLIKELEHATSGVKYHGWKGGEYSYDKDQELFVANPGETGDCRIVGIMDAGWKVVLKTGYRPW